MRHIYRFEAMNTPCEVTIYARRKDEGDRAASALLKEVKRLEKKYSFYDTSSYLSRLNRREENRLDPETRELLRRSRIYWTETNGVFDVTVGTIKALYHAFTDLQAVEKRKQEMAAYVGCDRFAVKKGKLYFDNPYTRIDLGGLVKEYAVDRAAAVLRKSRIEAALVNFGGDIYALGRKPDGTPFRIGIRDPKAPQVFAAFVELEDEAIATSASYERFFGSGESRISHILHTHKEAALERSVSVISPRCERSGVYSTALMIDETIETPYRVIRL